MTDRTPLDDAALDRLLGLAPPPPEAPDLVGRVVAEAQRPGRAVLPGWGRPPARPRRWARRTVWTGVIALNLLLASAVAAAFGGGVLSMTKIAVVAQQIAHHLRHPLERATPSKPRRALVRRQARVGAKPVEPTTLPQRLPPPHALPMLPMAQPYRPIQVFPTFRGARPDRLVVSPHSLHPHAVRLVPPPIDRHLRRQQTWHVAPDRPMEGKGERRIRPRPLAARRADASPVAHAPLEHSVGPAWRARAGPRDAEPWLNGPHPFRGGRGPGWRRRFGGPNAGPGPRMGPPRGPGRPFRRWRRPF